MGLDVLFGSDGDEHGSGLILRRVVILNTKLGPALTGGAESFVSSLTTAGVVLTLGHPAVTHVGLGLLILGGSLSLFNGRATLGNILLVEVHGEGRLEPLRLPLVLVGLDLLLGLAVLVLLLEGGLLFLVVVELLLLALLSGLRGGLSAVGEPSGRGLLLAHVVVSRLTSVSHGSVSTGHAERGLLLLSLGRLGALTGGLSCVDVVFVVLDILDLHLVAVGVGRVLEHESRRTTSGLDLISADITLVHGLDGNILGDIDVVGEVDLFPITALVFRLGAECQSVVLVGVGLGASVRGILHLVTALILAAGLGDLGVRVELLSVVTLEAEVVTKRDTLSASKVSAVLCRGTGNE